MAGSEHDRSNSQWVAPAAPPTAPNTGSGLRLNFQQLDREIATLVNRLDEMLRRAHSDEPGSPRPVLHQQISEHRVRLKDLERLRQRALS